MSVMCTSEGDGECMRSGEEVFFARKSFTMERNMTTSHLYVACTIGLWGNKDQFPILPIYDVVDESHVQVSAST